MEKQIEKVITPPAPHMVGDGFRMYNFFPGNEGEMTRMSPFFVMDYGAKIEFPPSEHQRGVGVHPHRGFETVTMFNNVTLKVTIPNGKNEPKKFQRMPYLNN